MTDNPAGWQADPTGRHEHRYWDGSQWTDNVADGGVANTDAYDAGAGGESVDAAADPIVDPTVAEPVTPADTTAAWPTSAAPPPPPVPPTYAGPVQPESGGSKRGLLIGGGILAAVVIAVAAFLLMGGDDDDSGVEARLAAQIKSESDGQLSDEQADCVAAHLVDEIGEERMAEVDFDSDDPPEGMEDELVAASFGAITACDIDPTALGGSSDGDKPTDDGDDEGDGLGDVEFDGDMEEMLADIYEESLGLDRDKAECLAGRLGEAISSGDLSEQEAMSDVFSYLEDCDISMEEISN